MSKGTAQAIALGIAAVTVLLAPEVLEAIVGIAAVLL